MFLHVPLKHDYGFYHSLEATEKSYISDIW